MQQTEMKSNEETAEAEIFVYGTLRTNNAGRATLSGFEKNDEQHFPTIVPSEGSEVDGQIVTRNLATTDRYEGYSPSGENTSLYWRLPVADSGVWVYVANPAHPMWRNPSFDYTKAEAESALDTALLSR